MVDDKKKEEIQKRVQHYLNEGILEKGNKEFVEFFLENAKKSLETAELLYEISTKEEMQKNMHYPNFDGLLWVINASYYSMFYITRALLENKGIKLKAEYSIHALTFDALLYYFYLTGKIQKHFIDAYTEAKEEVRELLGKEKDKELIESYSAEKKKRGTFTYSLGAVVLQGKAKTSLERARYYNQTIRKMIQNEK